MRICLTILCILLTSSAIFAQAHLCISNGQTANSIDFKPEQVDSYLHLDRYKVVLFGERHNGSFDPEIEYHLLANLNKRYGIRHVFKEIGVAAAWHFNQYLLSGDTSYLYSTPLPCTYGQWPVFWTRLYNYNSGLPDHLKFIIHGVDFERTEVFKTIIQLSPEGRSVPASLHAVMDTIAAHVADKPLGFFVFTGGRMTATIDNSPFTKTLRYIQAQLAVHPHDAETYFGANYPVIKDIIANTSRVTVKPKPRNKTMFRAIRRAVRDHQIQKFAGIFGGQHTTYTVRSSISNAAVRLPGIRKTDILNIEEVLYNLEHGGGTSVKAHDQIKSLNTGCKASIWPADAVPGYRKRADYVIIADLLR